MSQSKFDEQLLAVKDKNLITTSYQKLTMCKEK